MSYFIFMVIYWTIAIGNLVFSFLNAELAYRNWNIKDKRMSHGLVALGNFIAGTGMILLMLFI
jgi:hypothetical protein